MSFYLITGKLGSGKSVTGVSKALDYLRRGLPVASNIELAPELVLGHSARYVFIRLPDFPVATDFWSLGSGNETTDESRNGLLLLDEGAFFLNARNWNDKGRDQLVEWFLMSRKQGWDVMILIQSVSALDKQVREMVGEHVVYCRRLDRVRIAGMHLPRLFFAAVKYGAGPNAPTVDRWLSRGTDVFSAFPTKQVFQSDGPRTTYMHSRLSAWHLRGRFMSEWQKVKAKFWVLVFLFCAFAFIAGGATYRLVNTYTTRPVLPIRAEITGYVVSSDGAFFTLANGDTFKSSSYSLTGEGLSVEYSGARYVEMPSSALRAGK